ncbi:MAG: PTS sugar transporter subunit IIA [Selenomonadaceae bacterium]|nr:PTS sugar transporter subunit IIA [Selenomonadaceae bacterium]
MFGIIVGTHGEFANGILESAQMILGEDLVKSGVRAVILKRGEGPENVIEKYNAAIKDLGSPERVLFLNDLRGGTPYNAASTLAVGDEHYGIVAGVNFPMLIAMIQEQMTDDGSETIKELMEKAVEAGKEGVIPTSYEDLNAPAEDEDDL